MRADTVLRATESYTTQLPGQRLAYLPLYSLMIATEPLSDERRTSLGWRWRDGLLVGDLHHLFFYAQRTTDGRIAIGGRGAPYRLREPISERNERSAVVAKRLPGRCVGASRLRPTRRSPTIGEARWRCPATGR